MDFHALRHRSRAEVFDHRLTSPPRGKRKAAETPMMEISAAKVGGDAKGSKTGCPGQANPIGGQAVRPIHRKVRNRLTSSRLRKHDAASKKNHSGTKKDEWDS